MNKTSEKTPSVLIADDHNIMRKTLRQWLSTKFPSLNIIEASSGEQALEMLNENELQLILMDIHLPGINGIDATSRIKKKFPKLPIIVLTVQEDERYQFEAEQAGADAYVIKRKMYAELVPLMLSFLSIDSNL